VTVGISVAQLLPAVVGALLGVPGGLAVYDAARNEGPTIFPRSVGLRSWSWAPSSPLAC
jgi:hypothetical protein